MMRKDNAFFAVIQKNSEIFIFLDRKKKFCLLFRTRTLSQAATVIIYTITSYVSGWIKKRNDTLILKNLWNVWTCARNVVYLRKISQREISEYAKPLQIRHSRRWRTLHWPLRRTWWPNIPTTCYSWASTTTASRRSMSAILRDRNSKWVKTNHALVLKRIKFPVPVICVICRNVKQIDSKIGDSI